MSSRESSAHRHERLLVAAAALAAFGAVVLLVFGHGDVLVYTPLVVMTVCALSGFVTPAAPDRTTTGAGDLPAPAPRAIERPVLGWSPHRHQSRSVVDASN